LQVLRISQTAAVGYADERQQLIPLVFDFNFNCLIDSAA
jgi:hypothetical protein